MTMEYIEIPGLDDENIPAWDGQSSSKLDPGEYAFEVSGANYEPTKSGNGNNLVVEVTVIEAEATENQQFVGKELKHFIFTGKKGVKPEKNRASIGRLKQFLTACTADFGSGFKPSDLVGARFWGTVQLVLSNKPGPDGLMEERTFTNIVNERPYEVQTKTNGKAAKAPIQTQKGNTRPTARV